MWMAFLIAVLAAIASSVFLLSLLWLGIRIFAPEKLKERIEPRA